MVGEVEYVIEPARLTSPSAPCTRQWAKECLATERRPLTKRTLVRSA